MTVEIVPPTMKAVVLKAPHEIVVEERPTPEIQLDDDVIIKVHLAGLCGKPTKPRVKFRG